jgi:predicted ABC-type ATPase
VAQGGHNVAEAVIRRRFEVGWLNFREKYRVLVDAWALYDNSGDQPVLVEQATNT